MNEKAIGVVKRQLAMGVALTLLLVAASFAVNYQAFTMLESLHEDGTTVSADSTRVSAQDLSVGKGDLTLMTLRKAKMLSMTTTAVGALVLVMVWFMIVRAVTASLKRDGAG